MQCWIVVAPGALQSLSLAQSTHFLLAASHTFVPQSREVWQVVVATQVLATHSSPGALMQSALVVHDTHSP
jgi:hypothetical protein